MSERYIITPYGIIPQKELSALFGLFAVASGLYFLWDKASHWYLLGAPYKQVAWFYWHTLGLFLSSCYYVFMFFWDNSFTGFKNLNFLIGLIFGALGVIAWIFLVMMLISFVAGIGSAVLKMEVKAFINWLITLYVIPIVFMLIWLFFSWLFA